MKKLLLILLCLPMIGFGQDCPTWTKTYNLNFETETVSTSKQTSDGGFVIVGHVDAGSFTASECRLIKTDMYGNKIWDQVYNTSVIDGSQGVDVQQTIDGGYIIVGSGRAFNPPAGQPVDDLLLIKTNATGNIVWIKTYPNLADFGTSVLQTSDGGYIVTGMSHVSNQYGDAFLMKTDSLGDVLWNQTYNLASGGSEINEAYSVKQTIDGGYVVCGITYINNIFNAFLIKTNANGNQQWSQIYGGAGTDRLSTVQQTLDTGFVLCGYSPSLTNGDWDIWLVKTDSNGNQQWEKRFDNGLNTDDKGFSAIQTSDGGYIVTGVAKLNGSSWTSTRDLYLIKTDDNGIEQWSNIFASCENSANGSHSFEYRVGQSVHETQDGGYVVAVSGVTVIYLGGTNGFEYDFDVALIKTNSTGNTTSTLNADIKSNRSIVKTVDMLGKQTKPKTNTPLIEIYDDGTVEKRIVVE